MNLKSETEVKTLGRGNGIGKLAIYGRCCWTTREFTPSFRNKKYK